MARQRPARADISARGVSAFAVMDLASIGQAVAGSASGVLRPTRGALGMSRDGSARGVLRQTQGALGMSRVGSASGVLRQTQGALGMSRVGSARGVLRLSPECLLLGSAIPARLGPGSFPVSTCAVPPPAAPQSRTHMFERTCPVV
eukprot:365558-Chlamydomonas_euryale.AAC.25